MGFFGKAGKKSASAQKKMGDSISIRKLQSQIKAFQVEIEKLYTAAGEKCYAAYACGAEPAGVEEIFAGIDSINSNIASINAEIDRLSNIIRCEGCNSGVAAGLRFCPNCGTKMPEPPAPEAETCPDCGAVRSEGARFCEKCGHCYYGAQESAEKPVIPAMFTPGEEPTIAAPFVFDPEPAEAVVEEDSAESVAEAVYEAPAVPEAEAGVISVEVIAEAETDEADTPVIMPSQFDDDDDIPMTMPVDPSEDWFVDAPAKDDNINI